MRVVRDNKEGFHARRASSECAKLLFWACLATFNVSFIAGSLLTCGQVVQSVASGCLRLS